MAAFWNYSKPDRRKGQYFGYVRANGNRCTTIPATEPALTQSTRTTSLPFSIGSDGKKGYAVVKKNYIFDTSTNFFAPMTHADASGDEKHLCLDGNLTMPNSPTCLPTLRSYTPSMAITSLQRCISTTSCALCVLNSAKARHRHSTKNRSPQHP